MFSPNPVTTSSLALQLQTLQKRSPLEWPANSVVPEKSAPHGRQPEKFSLVKKPQSARTVPRLDTPVRPMAPLAVAPEILAAISAALAQSFGSYVAIRSVKKLAPRRAAVTPWAQQGRALVHASHDLPRFSQQPTRTDPAA